ncbi:MAG: hypothetical protein CMM52_08035 [Rhodospirillaceae bacterium]|nr:hypothetical protein [Rhodospirillaceae bacterium]|tara:strand:- start:8778 stop:9116 length:339 start_codon:yes stop_codon:yes gene_type:complete
MTTPEPNVPDNLIELDLSAFSKEDVEKIKALGEKQRLLYRWFRHERTTQPGLDQFFIYSGARGRTPYSAYRVERHMDARYAIFSQRSGEMIAEGRTLDSVLDHLPDDFFYSI